MRCLNVLTAMMALAWTTVPHTVLAADAMPVEQQNTLVQKHCTVCHKGANPGGGLSLESFDAARPDPSVIGMMLVKINADGAMSAAGVPRPDPATMDAFIGALSAAAARTSSGDGVWSVTLEEEPKRGHDLVTARMTQEIVGTPRTPAAVYELTLACSGASKRGEMKLATYTRAGSRGVLEERTMPAQTGAAVPFTYVIDRQSARSGSLHTTQSHAGSPDEAMPLPSHTLAISDVFPRERVSFAFESLSPTVRQVLATCFTAAPATR